MGNSLLNGITIHKEMQCQINQHIFRQGNWDKS